MNQNVWSAEGKHRLLFLQNLILNTEIVFSISALYVKPRRNTAELGQGRLLPSYTEIRRNRDGVKRSLSSVKKKASPVAFYISL